MNTAVYFELKNATLFAQPVIPTLNGVFPYPQHLLNANINISIELICFCSNSSSFSLPFL